MAYTIDELAHEIDLEIIGDGKHEITHIAELDQAGQGALSFAVSARYRHSLNHTNATAVIVTPELKNYGNAIKLVSKNPYLSFARAAQLLYPQEEFVPGIDASAVIHPECNISENVYIGPNVVISEKCEIESKVYIGANSVISASCRIGANTRFLPRVTIIGPTLIGKRVIVHPGVVIGSDGFGLANDNGVWEKIPQIGRVLIGNDVEIGANTTIDRGALQDTIIEDGVKLDNQIQIAHNVKIGAHTAIAGCVGIAGSAIIGKYCAIGGGAGIQGHIEITDGVQVMGMTKISQSIDKPGVYTSGTAAQDNKQWIRNAMRFKELDSIAKRLLALEKHISDKRKG
ncbi:MAG: UDP-3-O-(3-hydroxymyristoyl)glucosamine N-acyltransferase [Pseudomonadota bacterium]